MTKAPNLSSLYSWSALLFLLTIKAAAYNYGVILGKEVHFVCTFWKRPYHVEGLKVDLYIITKHPDDRGAENILVPTDELTNSGELYIKLRNCHNLSLFGFNK